jgi:hypothetical protein
MGLGYRFKGSRFRVQGLDIETPLSGYSIISSHSPSYYAVL